MIQVHKLVAGKVLRVTRKTYDVSIDGDFEIYINEYSKLGYGAFFGSVLTGEGFDWIKGILTDKVALFVEHSGVEKVL